MSEFNSCAKSTQSAVILTHPKFDRPKVTNPRRRGRLDEVTFLRTARLRKACIERIETEMTADFRPAPMSIGHLAGYLSSMLDLDYAAAMCAAEAALAASQRKAM